MAYNATGGGGKVSEADADYMPNDQESLERFGCGNMLSALIFEVVLDSFDFVGSKGCTDLICYLPISVVSIHLDGLRKGIQLRALTFILQPQGVDLRL